MKDEPTPQERINEIVEEWFFGSAEDASDAVRDLLSALSDKIEQAEPYATRTIDDLRAVASRMDPETFEPEEDQ